MLHRGVLGTEDASPLPWIRQLHYLHKLVPGGCESDDCRYVPGFLCKLWKLCRRTVTCLYLASCFLFLSTSSNAVSADKLCDSRCCVFFFTPQLSSARCFTAEPSDIAPSRRGSETMEQGSSAEASDAESSSKEDDSESSDEDDTDEDEEFEEWDYLIDPDQCSDSEPDRWFKVAPLVCDCGACWYCLNRQGVFPHPFKITHPPLCMY